MNLRAVLTGTALTIALAASLVATAQPGSAEESGDTHAFISSFDSTQLQVHLMRTTHLRADGTAPVLMIAHGFGEEGPESPDEKRLAGAPTVRAMLDAGYHVLTWDARGHRDSEGMAMVDSPDHEMRDAQTLLDWAAAQPGVQLDGPGDPRVGMSGASYGGIIQFLLAAHDDRVDVISPGYTANSLGVNSLAKNGKFKEGWGLALAGMAGVGNVPAGLTSPLGPKLHTLDPAAVAGLTSSTIAGTVSPAFSTYLAYRSPATYLSRIHVPTLIQGGTSDTIFPVENLVDDFMALKARGIPVKMLWNCEGHSLCPGDAGPLEEKFNAAVITWMDRWLKRDRSVDTGPQFEWIADNESSYRSAPAYPPRQVGSLHAIGAGSLPLLATAPLTSPGFVFIGAQPALPGPTVLDVRIPAPSSGANVVGFPRLELTYSGLALPRRTWLYAQVVDDATGRVVNVQVTPVPILLDGARHTTVVELNAIATRATSSSRYRLQLTTGSLIFGLQRSTGTMRLHNVDISLPLIR